MRTTFLPNPEQYPTWQAWANILLERLKVKEPNAPIQLALYPKAKLPPANQDGMIIFSEDGAYISLAGNWIKLNQTEVFLTSPNETVYKLVVADDGTLSTEAVV